MQTAMQILSLTDKIKESRNRSYDNVGGMSRERAPLKVLHYTPIGRKTRTVTEKMNPATSDLEPEKTYNYPALDS